jgi:Mor family transcriptional regulator
MTKPPTNRQKFGYLPHVLSLLLPEIGEDGLARLVQEFGGQRLYLSDGERAVRKLAPVLGDETSEKIAKVMTENIMTRFDVPSMHDYRVLQKSIQIEADYNAGEFVRDIAKKFSMTERGVYKALRKLRDDGRKQSLRAEQVAATRASRAREAQRLYEDGVSVKEIAEQLGVSQTSIYEYLLRMLEK